MNLRNHLVQIVAEFFYADALLGGDEDAGGLFLGDPAVFQLVQGAVPVVFRFQGELVVRLVGIGVHFVENDKDGLVDGPDFTKGLFHDLHLLLEVRVGNIHDMDQHIRLPDLVQGTLERFDQLGGQFPDETDGVTQQEGAVLDHDFPDGGVQGREKFVLRKNVRFGQ